MRDDRGDDERCERRRDERGDETVREPRSHEGDGGRERGELVRGCRKKTSTEIEEDENPNDE